MNRQIVLSITPEEFSALQREAALALRPVKDQARYILRTALLAATLPADGNVEHVAVSPPVCTPEPIFSP